MSRRTSLNIPKCRPAWDPWESTSSRNGFAGVRCTLGRVCESIVHPVTHVVIPSRPLSSRTTTLPALTTASLLHSRARPMSPVHSAFAAMDRELNERVGGPRIGHAISARGYRVVRAYNEPAGRSKIQRLRSLEFDERLNNLGFQKKRFRDLGILIFPPKISNLLKHIGLKILELQFWDGSLNFYYLMNEFASKSLEMLSYKKHSKLFDIKIWCFQNFKALQKLKKILIY